MKAALLLVGLLFLAVPLAALAGGEEQACTDLIDDGDSATTCVCSEPLDEGGESFPNVGDHQYDYVQTTDPTDCTGEVAVWIIDTNSDSLEAALEAKMPAANTVEYVLKIKAHSTGFQNNTWIGNGIKTSTPSFSLAGINRLCMRYYYNVTADYSGTGANNVGCYSERNKIFQMTFSGTGDFMQSSETAPSGSGCTGPTADSPYTRTYKQHVLVLNAGSVDQAYNLENPATTDITFFMCQDDWCRVETCVSGDLDATGSKTLEVVETIIDGTEEANNIYTATSATATGVPPLTGLGGDMYHGQTDHVDGPQGHRYMSYFMVAAWDTDSGQFIGAACEVEGGCGGSTPTGVLQ